MLWSRNCACTDHVDDHTLTTLLITHWSRAWSFTDHVAIMQWSRDCTCTDHIIVGNDHVAIMHWSRGWSCTVHVTDHVLITWLIMYRSRGYHALITYLSCTEHVADHTLIMWLLLHKSRDCTFTDHVIEGNDNVAVMHWSRGWSCTAHVTEHALIT